MKRAKTYLVRIFAAAIVVALLMVNIQVDTERPMSWENTNIELTINEANAQASGYYLTSSSCWVDGRTTWICKAGSGTCCVSCQGCCSDTDPCHSD